MIWGGVDLAELDEMSQNKRLDFERKKMMKLYEFYLAQKEIMGDNPDGYPRVFLREYAIGERMLFEEFMQKMIE